MKWGKHHFKGWVLHLNWNYARGDQAFARWFIGKVALFQNPKPGYRLMSMNVCVEGKQDNYLRLGVTWKSQDAWSSVCELSYTVGGQKNDFLPLGVLPFDLTT